MPKGLFHHLQHTVVTVLLLASGALVASCQSAPPPPPALPEMSFTRFQPIYLDVANVDITEEYRSPQREPNIEHLLQITPAEGMRAWVRDRLKQAGSEKSLQIIIRDASVIGHPAQTPDQLLGPAPNRRYDARLEVDLRVYGTGAMSEANVTVIATQTVTLSDAANLDDRKRVFYRMVYDLLEQANAELEKQIFTYFTRYIMYAQTP